MQNISLLNLVRIYKSQYLPEDKNPIKVGNSADMNDHDQLQYFKDFENNFLTFTLTKGENDDLNSKTISLKTLQNTESKNQYLKQLFEKEADEFCSNIEILAQSLTSTGIDNSIYLNVFLDKYFDGIFSKFSKKYQELLTRFSQNLSPTNPFDFYNCRKFFFQHLLNKNNLASDILSKKNDIISYLDLLLPSAIRGQEASRSQDNGSTRIQSSDLIIETTPKDQASQSAIRHISPNLFQSNLILENKELKNQLETLRSSLKTQEEHNLQLQQRLTDALKSNSDQYDKIQRLEMEKKDHESEILKLNNINSKLEIRNELLVELFKKNKDRLIFSRDNDEPSDLSRTISDRKQQLEIIPEEGDKSPSSPCQDIEISQQLTSSQRNDRKVLLVINPAKVDSEAIKDHAGEQISQSPSQTNYPKLGILRGKKLTSDTRQKRITFRLSC